MLELNLRWLLDNRSKKCGSEVPFNGVFEWCVRTFEFWVALRIYDSLNIPFGPDLNL